jgi:hypothetical protein
MVDQEEEMVDMLSVEIKRCLVSKFCGDTSRSYLVSSLCDGKGECKDGCPVYPTCLTLEGVDWELTRTGIVQDAYERMKGDD